MTVAHSRPCDKTLLVSAEFHGGVAVRIECEYALVEPLCLCITGGLACQPLEDGHHGLVSCHDEAFGMPLYAEYALVFVAFVGFDNMVGALGCDAELRAWVLDGLVMKGVDGQF